ncbi:facilitated trehalose transporter Tret1-like [Agrilus planipennis]|uniref:Facilitated trehalose transporter Tret1-like n=1 Tax=Agrilus planipennis TaxID=224129 RepID=A0A1W4XCS8_AGRPL|nr:facilitated trehalose transporter Tret1-like [Agrilus planipennis]
MLAPREFLKGTRYMQLIASISVTFSVAVTGMFISWSSPAVPLLTGEKEGLDFKLTTEQTSWVVSGYILGTAIGNAVVGIPTEKLGRRITLLLGAPLYFLCWIGIIFSKDFYMLLISRMIGGIGSSTAFVCCSLYIGEIADKDLRGRLASAMSVLKLSGNLYVLSVGPFMSYYALAWSCSVIPVLLFVALLLMPESSYYHLKRGNVEKARASLVWFAASTTTNQEIEEKLESIKDGVDKDMRNKSSLKELFTSKIHRKAVVAIIGLKFLQQLCGITAIESYMQTIIQQSGSSLSGDLSSIIFGIVQFVGEIHGFNIFEMHLGHLVVLYVHVCQTNGWQLHLLSEISNF